MPLFLIAFGLARRARHNRVALLLGLALLILVGGGVAFSATDNIGVGTGLYWAVTTVTTVGYGDVIPHNGASQIIAVCVMLTAIPIFGAVFALVAGATVINHMRRLLGMETRLPSKPYTLVYGDDEVVPQVIDELLEADVPVVLVAAKRPPHLRDGVTFIAGDPTDEAVMKVSEPARATRALIACDTDADALVVAVTLRTSAPDLEVYALTDSSRVAQAMQDLGVAHTLSSIRLVSHTVAKSLETPGAGDVVLQLVDSSDYCLRERTVDASLDSRHLSEARAVAGTLVLGISRNGRVDLGVTDDPILASGDRLIELAVRPTS